MTIAPGRLKDEVSSWPGISVRPHRFAALEYRLGKAEVGHVHFWGDVDIPFPRRFMTSSLSANLLLNTAGSRIPAGQHSGSVAKGTSNTRFG